jgi:hypothetical protein
MWVTEHSVETTAAPQAIWRQWSDVDRWPEWNGDIERIEVDGPFVDVVEPEELMRVLAEFHGTIGGLVGRFDATVGFIEGDGVQLFFNDPIEVPDPAMRAVRLGCALREEMAKLTALWRKRGYDVDFGAGIALGYATCGEVGFEGRSDYAAIGAVTNLACRRGDRRPDPDLAAPPRRGRRRHRRRVGRPVHAQRVPATGHGVQRRRRPRRGDDGGCPRPELPVSD